MKGPEKVITFSDPISCSILYFDMYTIYRNIYYKRCILFGIICCAICCVPIFLLIAINGYSWNNFSFVSICILVPYILFYLIKYFRKSLNFLALKIDDNGMILCSKKNEEVFVPWEKIKYVIFVVDDYGSKVIVRQHNKEIHELLLTDYFYVLKPRGAIKAVYKYADDIDKIRVVKDCLSLTYNCIMWNLSEREKKKRRKER